MIPVSTDRRKRGGGTQSVVRAKTDKIKKPSAMSPSLSSKFAEALAPGGRGPKQLDASRDAWANALTQMGQVRAVDPITAAAQTAGMGLAGWGQGKAVRQREEGENAFRAKLANALNGGGGSLNPETMKGLMMDPYAEGSQDMLMQLWERANPSPETLLKRQQMELEMQRTRRGMTQDEQTFTQQQEEWKRQGTEWEQQQAELARQKAIRGGKQDTVSGFLQDHEEAGGTLFSPEMQMRLRQSGIAGVSPADSSKYERVQPYAEAGDYENAFEQMNAPTDKGDFIEADGAIYNTRTGEWVQNPNGPKGTDDIQEYQQAVRQGYQGGFRDWMLEMKKAGASSTNILPGEKAYGQERGKGMATMANDIDKAEQSAYSTMSALDSMELMMQDPSFYSGAGAEHIMALRQMVAALGGDPNSVSSMETFAAQAKRLALDSMGGSLGTGFSNADRDFVTGQVLSLANTPAGNKQLVDIQRKLQQRKIEIARKAREYEIKNGQLDARFLQELSVWSEQNPLFQRAPGPRPQPAPGAGTVPKPDIEQLLRMYGSPQGGQ